MQTTWTYICEYRENFRLNIDIKIHALKIFPLWATIKLLLIKKYIAKIFFTSVLCYISHPDFTTTVPVNGLYMYFWPAKNRIPYTQTYLIIFFCVRIYITILFAELTWAMCNTIFVLFLLVALSSAFRLPMEGTEIIFKKNNKKCYTYNWQ